MISVTSTTSSECSLISVNGRIIEVEEPYTIYVIEPMEAAARPGARRENTAVKGRMTGNVEVEPSMYKEDSQHLKDVKPLEGSNDKLRMTLKVLGGLAATIVARFFWLRNATAASK